jgi:predicted ATPase/transcriptional regulator with XRE-family HTH domain
LTKPLPFSPDKEKPPLPDELLRMFRLRSGFSQAELAELLGLKSERMLRYWEGGYSLPAPDRLQALIEVYLRRQVFVEGQERQEVGRLWQTVKDMFDVSRKRLETYPIFDEAWFTTLTATGSNKPEHQNQRAAASDQASFFYNLPDQITRLIGRERQVTAVRELLNRKEMRLVTLTGPGGTGKTRLALQVASEMRREFEHGVCFVALAVVTDPDHVAAAICRAFNLDSPPSQPPWQTLTAYLQPKKLLLVLDNFEQVLEAISLVGELLAAAPKLKVLITSRAALRLYGETEFQVPPLELPDLHKPLVRTELINYASIGLFVERAQAVRRDFTLTDENGPVIAEICTRLDGLPLAIELAAPRLRLMSPQALLARLITGPLKILTAGPRNLPARQQTLRSTLDWSYNLLEESEQRLLARLGVFLGSYTLEAIETITGPNEQIPISSPLSADEIINGVNSLLEKSLLKQLSGAQGETRFTMLEIIREYALDKLEEWDELEFLQQRHKAYYQVLAGAVASEIRQGEIEPVHWVARLEQEYDNLQLALEESDKFNEEMTEPVSKAFTPKPARRVEFRLVIHRPLEEVFDFMLHLQNMQSWGGAKTVDIASSKGIQLPVGVGTTARIVSNILGRRVETTSIITRFEPYKLVRARTISGPMTTQVEARFYPVEGGCQITMIAEVEAGSVFRLVAPVFASLVQKEVEAVLQNLKQALEAET